MYDMLGLYKEGKDGNNITERVQMNETCGCGCSEEAMVE